MGQRQISSVPPEVLRIIFKFILNEDPSKFVRLLQVSRLWAALGKPVLWKDIVLSKNNLAAFASSVQLAPESGLHTHSLTIRDLHNIGGSACAAKVPLDGVTREALIHSIAALKFLATFSISNTGACCNIGSDTSEQLLRALPRSVTSLEVALHNCGRQPKIARQVLVSLMKSLHHFRCTGEMICYHTFNDLTEECLNLKTIVINDSRRPMGSSCECRPIHPTQSIFYSSRDGEMIALAGRKAYMAGYLPNLTSFIIITRTTRNQDLDHALPVSRSGTNDDTMTFPARRDHAFSSLQCRDILANQTTCYPIAQLSERKQYWMIRYPNPGADLDITVENQTFEGFGEYSNLGILIEGLDTWEETTKGSRFPPAYLDSFSGQSHEYTWADTQLLAPAALVPAIKQVTKSRLWFWERKYGRMLLHPVCFDGLERTPLLVRERFEEETRNPFNIGETLTTTYGW